MPIVKKACLHCGKIYDHNDMVPWSPDDFCSDDCQIRTANAAREKAEAMLREASVFMTCEWGDVCGQDGWMCDKCHWLSRYRAEYGTQAAAQGGEVTAS